MKFKLMFMAGVCLLLFSVHSLVFAQDRDSWKDYNSIESVDIARALIASEPNEETYYQRLARILQNKNEKGIRIFVDGVLQDCKNEYGVDAVIEQGRVLVPLRAIGESTGADVSWDGRTMMVNIHYKETTIKLSTNSAIATINDKPYSMNVPAKIENQRLLVPLRFIAQGLQKKVGFIDINKDLKLIYIHD